MIDCFVERLLSVRLRFMATEFVLTEPTARALAAAVQNDGGECFVQAVSGYNRELHVVRTGDVVAICLSALGDRV